MNHREARAALAESARRREQTIAAGTAPWSWPTTFVAAGTILALGLSIDMEMIWLGGFAALAFAAALTTRAVMLRDQKSSPRWSAALVGTFVLAVLVDVAVQFAVRAGDLPLPNTWGALAAAAVFVLLARPVHARAAASRRP